jgi:hypothetical protein
MNSTTIKIDGSKLRELLESKTGKTIYQIATESGYSKNVISNAVREGYASSAVQNIAKLYGITPDEYKIKDPEPIKEPAQISIDDIETIKREELKALIKEALIEVVNAQEFRTCFDPHRQIFEIYSRVEEG